eukprot:jgi/Chrzof1/4187/Cz14g02070.t1
MQPKAIHELLNEDISSVACGAEYTLAFSRTRQQVYSWGWGDFGRLGHGDSNDVFMPQQIAFFSGMPIKQVACGDTHTLAITDDGALYSFGRNQNGQLGHGNTSDVLSPKLVEGLKCKVVTSIAAGAEHTVAATQDGEVYSWGWGRYGNLGDNDRCDRHVPTLVTALDTVKIMTVACGWRHSAAVSDDGRVYTFGWSKYGQLGHGDYSDRLIPTEVTALAGKPITLVAGGWRHTMAADAHGRTYAWGWNKFGQLGLGDTQDRPEPAEIVNLSGSHVHLLACGWRHTLAATEDGMVYSWGRGVNGQLGHGDEIDVHVPKKLEGLSKGTLKTADIIATATAPGGYVAPADRYAVVPDGDESGEVNDLAPGGVGSLVPLGGPVPKKQRTGDDTAMVPGL